MINIPHISIHPNNIATYSQIYTDEGTLYTSGREGIKNDKRTNIHKLSPNAKKKLNRAITYMTHIADTKQIKGRRYSGTFKFKISFVTLTLSATQIHTDNEIKKKCLEPFLDYMRKMYNAKRFVWKAERQKNGNIHFHILFDVYVPYEVIRKKWNQYQNNLGYINTYYSNHNIDLCNNNYQSLLSSVNSTDVHSVKKVRDLAKYMCKYMLKNTKNNRIRMKRKPEHGVKKFFKGMFSVSGGAKKYLMQYVNTGRIWSCSYDLVNLKGGTDLISSCYDNELNILIDSGKCFVKREAYFTYISFDNTILQQLKCANLLELLNTFIAEQFKQPTNLI